MKTLKLTGIGVLPWATPQTDDKIASPEIFDEDKGRNYPVIHVHKLSQSR